METRTRTASGHSDMLTVTKRAAGWEVRETRDTTIVRSQMYSDWHRVERAVHVFELADLARVIPRTDIPAPPQSQSGDPHL